MGYVLPLGSHYDEPIYFSVPNTFEKFQLPMNTHEKLPQHCENGFSRLKIIEMKNCTLAHTVLCFDTLMKTLVRTIKCSAPSIIQIHSFPTP